MRVALYEGDEEVREGTCTCLMEVGGNKTGGYLPEGMNEIGLRNELNEVFARCGR